MSAQSLSQQGMTIECWKVSAQVTHLELQQGGGECLDYVGETQGERKKLHGIRSYSCAVNYTRQSTPRNILV